MKRVSSLPPRSRSFPQSQEGESLLLVLLKVGMKSCEVSEVRVEL